MYAVGLGVGQRLKQQRVRDAEDGGGDADADGECQDGDGGEAGGLDERMEGVAEVLEHGLSVFESAWLECNASVTLASQTGESESGAGDTD